MLTPHVTLRGQRWQIDQDYACQSLLGLPANSIEELIYHNRKFYWTRWRILIKILPDFHVETIRKVYRVSIYVLLSRKTIENNKKGNTTAPELTTLPIHF